MRRQSQRDTQVIIDELEEILMNLAKAARSVENIAGSGIATSSECQNIKGKLEELEQVIGDVIDEILSDELENDSFMDDSFMNDF